MAALSDIRLGVVRGISHGLFGPPDPFVPQARALGARLLRVFLFWGQIEPRPGCYSWAAVDALMNQLDDAGADVELWITLCSSSPWATRERTDFLPPSPAHDLAAYSEFVRQVVRRCNGRVGYWQCDNEPSNIGLLWAGTAPEYVAQLRAMHAAVRDVDANAAVVLGGCGYDFLSSAAGSPQRQFFDHLADAGRDAFDVFDVHLYGDPHRVPEYIDSARRMMRAHGYEKPVLAGEYAGPALFEFPEAEAALQQALASLMTAPPVSQSTEALKEQHGQDTPERRAMLALYARMSDLPPRLQMFMAGCPPELEARRRRIACRQLVVRNLLALAAGVPRTLYWNLGPEVPAPLDPYMIMHLLVGKWPLLEYHGGVLADRNPEGDTFARLAGALAGVTRVCRLELPAQPAVFAFDVRREARAPLLVAWERRDAFDGEASPPIEVALPWPAPTADAIDPFGRVHPACVRGGAVRLQLTDTPLFVTPR